MLSRKLALVLIRGGETSGADLASGRAVLDRATDGTGLPNAKNHRPKEDNCSPSPVTPSIGSKKRQRARAPCPLWKNATSGSTRRGRRPGRRSHTRRKRTRIPEEGVCQLSGVAPICHNSVIGDSPFTGADINRRILCLMCWQGEFCVPSDNNSRRRNGTSLHRNFALSRPL